MAGGGIKIVTVQLRVCAAKATHIGAPSARITSNQSRESDRGKPRQRHSSSGTPAAVSSWILTRWTRPRDRRWGKHGARQPYQGLRPGFRLQL